MNQLRRLESIGLALACLVAFPIVDAGSQTPTSITLNTPNPCGKPTGRVNLSAPAPSGGYSMNLSSSAPAVVAVPVKATAAQGATVVTFEFTCTPTTQAVPVTITATSPNGNTTATFTVLAPVLQTFTIQPHNGGPMVQAQVILAGPAPTGGVVVTLLESSTRVNAPVSVTVPAGASNHSFAIPVNPAATPVVVPIVATGLAVSRTVDVTVNPPTPIALGFGTKPEIASSATLPSTRTVNSGGGFTGRITLNNESPSDGFPVQVTSSNPALINVASAVLFKRDSIYAAFSSVVGSVSQSTSVTLTATAGGVSTTASIVVAPPTISVLLVEPSKVIGGQDSQGKVRLSGPAPAGGSLVQLASGNTSKVLVPPTVLVPAGQQEVTFPIATFGLEQTTMVEVSASRETQRLARTMELAPEGPTAVVVPSTILGGMPANGRLDALLSTDDFVVSLSTDKPAIATVPQVVSFAAGVTSKAFTVQTTPVAADAQVTVTAMLVEKTRSSTTTSLMQQLNIVQPTFKRTTAFMVKAPVVTALEFANASVVGPGTTTGTVRLNGPAPTGGFTVRVTTDLDAKARPSPSADIVVPAGASSATFSVSTSPVTTTTTVYFTARTGTVTKVSSLQVRAP